jgi:hypothetical protein
MENAPSRVVLPNGVTNAKPPAPAPAAAPAETEAADPATTEPAQDP